MCFIIVIITCYLPGLAPCPFEGPALAPYPKAEPTYIHMIWKNQTKEKETHTYALHKVYLV